METLRTRLGLGVALVVSFVAVACAAPTIPNDTTGDDGSDPSSSASTKKPSKTPAAKTPTTAPEGDPTKPTPKPTPTTPTPTTPTTPTPTGANCSGSQTADACFDCCDAPTAGALAKADAAYGKCACGGGQCTSVCNATLCNGGQPSAACDQCLQQTCEPAADALCTSAACKAGQQCLQASGCNGKP